MKRHPMQDLARDYGRAQGSIRFAIAVISWVSKLKWIQNSGLKNSMDHLVRMLDMYLCELGFHYRQARRLYYIAHPDEKPRKPLS